MWRPQEGKVISNTPHQPLKAASVCRSPQRTAMWVMMSAKPQTAHPLTPPPYYLLWVPHTEVFALMGSSLTKRHMLSLPVSCHVMFCATWRLCKKVIIRVEAKGTVHSYTMNLQNHKPKSTPILYKVSDIDFMLYNAPEKYSIILVKLGGWQAKSSTCYKHFF